MLSIKIDDWVRQYINPKFESLDEKMERTPTSYRYGRVIDMIPFDWEVDESENGLFPITVRCWLEKTYPHFYWNGNRKRNTRSR